MDFHPVEANLRESFRVLATGRPRGDVLELPGVSIASLGAAFQMFNAAFLNRPVDGVKDLECRLDLAQRHFRSRGLPWALWICEDWLDRSARRSLTQTCARFGLRLSSEMPGMMAERLTAQNVRCRIWYSDGWIRLRCWMIFGASDRFASMCRWRGSARFSMVVCPIGALASSVGWGIATASRWPRQPRSPRMGWWVYITSPRLRGNVGADLPKL